MDWNVRRLKWRLERSKTKWVNEGMYVGFRRGESGEVKVEKLGKRRTKTRWTNKGIKRKWIVEEEDL